MGLSSFFFFLLSYWGYSFHFHQWQVHSHSGSWFSGPDSHLLSHAGLAGVFSRFPQCALFVGCEDSRLQNVTEVLLSQNAVLSFYVFQNLNHIMSFLARDAAGERKPSSGQYNRSPSAHMILSGQLTGKSVNTKGHILRCNDVMDSSGRDANLGVAAGTWIWIDEKEEEDIQGGEHEAYHFALTWTSLFCAISLEFLVL